MAQLSVPLPHPLRISACAAVMVGGAIGALARYGMTNALPHSASEFSWATLLTNLSGAALLGLLLPLMLKRLHHASLIRPFIATGVLGGYTTLSTYAVETDLLLSHQKGLLALAYVLASLLGGLAAAALGISLARHLDKLLPQPLPYVEEIAFVEDEAWTGVEDEQLTGVEDEAGIGVEDLVKDKQATNANDSEIGIEDGVEGK